MGIFSFQAKDIRVEFPYVTVESRLRVFLEAALFIPV